MITFYFDTMFSPIKSKKLSIEIFKKGENVCALPELPLTIAYEKVQCVY